MKKIKFKQYQTELINGSTGTINIPQEEDLRYIIQNRKFIQDVYSETFILTDAIAKFDFLVIKND